MLGTNRPFYTGISEGASCILAAFIASRWETLKKGFYKGDDYLAAHRRAIVGIILTRAAQDKTLWINHALLERREVRSGETRSEASMTRYHHAIKDLLAHRDIKLRLSEDGKILVSLSGRLLVRIAGSSFSKANGRVLRWRARAEPPAIRESPEKPESQNPSPRGELLELL